MLFQQFHPVQGLLEVAFPVSGFTIAVVEYLRPVHTDADQKMLRLEKTAEIIREQCGVGLHRVDDLSPSPVLSLQSNRFW